MDEKLLNLIGQKLDTLIRLMVTGLISGKRQREQIELLSLAGFEPKDIADAINTSPNTVRVYLSNLRKRNRQKYSKTTIKKEVTNE